MKQIADCAFPRVPDLFLKAVGCVAGQRRSDTLAESAPRMIARAQIAAAALSALLIAALLVPTTSKAAFPGRENGRIAYSFSGRIETINPDGTDRRILVDGDEPSYSADGTQIIFTNNGSLPGGIWIMGSSGENQRRVVSGSDLFYGPTFSPGGGRIAFVSEGSAERSLWVADVDGGHRRRIAHKPVNISFGTAPSWSPNGRWIAFGLGRNIYRVHPNGRGLERLTALPRNADGENPDFSPNGKRISFTRYLGYVRSDVFVMDADGSNPRRLTRGLGAECGTAFSPTGNRVVSSPGFAGGRINDLFSVKGNGTGGIFRITHLGVLDTFHGVWVTPCDPSWQPGF
jgi:tricorn protease-like protein